MADLPPFDETEEVAELHSGDHMTQQEFHRIYEKMPPNFRAELIGGIVYVASPLKRRHGRHHTYLGGTFLTYEGSTPGIEVGDNATVVLSEEDEPQPDLYLGIAPEYGGQWCENADGYIKGGPELTAEISDSSRSIDLHAKRERYAQAGVLEYLVVCLRPKQVRWFDLKHNREFVADAEGIYRSELFPGLWLHGEALLQLDYQRLMSVLQRGLASPEHQAFVQQLASRAPGR